MFLWDVAAGKTLRRYAGHNARVNAVAFGGEGDSVVVSGTCSPVPISKIL